MDNVPLTAITSVARRRSHHKTIRTNMRLREVVHNWVEVFWGEGSEWNRDFTDPIPSRTGSKHGIVTARYRDGVLVEYQRVADSLFRPNDVHFGRWVGWGFAGITWYWNYANDILSCRGEGNLENYYRICELYPDIRHLPFADDETKLMITLAIS